MSACVPLLSYGLEVMSRRHIPVFLDLAAAEGWLVTQWEMEFLLQTFPQGCAVVLQMGEPVGFVTAIRHGESGWIGNLLVRKDLRGGGMGWRLFQHAVASLSRSGVETIWLTASPAGLPLYEKLGFAAIDRVIRWRLNQVPVSLTDFFPVVTSEVMGETDRLGWGDRRHELLEALARRGSLLTLRDGFCILQPGEGWGQIGPWGCGDAGAASELLEQVLSLSGHLGKGLRDTAPLFVDVPERNEQAAVILAGKGFTSTGATILMYRGKPPSYRPDYVYALASMGSIG